MTGRKASASPFSSRTDLSQQGSYISYGTMNNDGLMTAHSVQPPHGTMQSTAGAQANLSGGLRNAVNNDYDVADKERRMPMSITVMEVPQEIRHKKSFLPFWSQS
jgi:hypothetical protein